MNEQQSRGQTDNGTMKLPMTLKIGFSIIAIVLPILIALTSAWALDVRHNVYTHEERLDKHAERLAACEEQYRSLQNLLCRIDMRVEKIYEWLKGD